MTRFFNTAGPCRPDIHFVLPPMRRLPEMSELIDRQSYFMRHAPRQTGKTTALLTLAAELTAQGRYAAALVSADVGAPFGNNPGAAEAAILILVALWRRNAEPMVRGQSYPEIAPHIVLMAYLQRVVNGVGMIEREYAAGSRRMDLCIRWRVRDEEQVVAVELKVWRDKQGDPLQEGLAQLEGYLGRLGLTEEFLVIFDRRRAADEVPWDERPRRENEALAGGKRVKVLRL